MNKYLFLSVLSILLSHSSANALPERVSNRTVNDFSDVLSAEEEKKLENKIFQYKENSSQEIIIVLLKGVVKSNAKDYTASLAKAWGLGDNSILVVSDTKEHTYGFYIGNNLSQTYPEWIIQKIEHLDLKHHFRDKKYYTGIEKAIDTFIGLQSGLIKPDDLKKDSSDFFTIALILIIPIFFLLIPIWQFWSISKAHFSTRRMSFASGVRLISPFTSGKVLFEDFSMGKGVFIKGNVKSEVMDSFAGGGGIAGSW